MNRIFTFIIASSMTLNCYAQEIGLYGFYNDGSQAGDFLTLGQVDPATGTLVGADSIFTMEGYALGSSSFDQVNRFYSFIGVDSGYSKRFVSWSLDGDSIVGQPVFGETVNDIQYDMNTMVYYGMGNYIVDTLVWDTVMNIYIFDYASRLVTIDPQTGVINEIKKLPELRAFPVGGSTFDANNGRYIINGKDPGFDDRLFIVDAVTGDVLSSSSLDLQPGEYLNELEYNNVNDKLYGLYRDNNEGTKAIVSVDLQTSEIEQVADLSQVWAFTPGASVFHQESQGFILYYLDYSNNSKLITVDVVSGEVISDVVLGGNFTEIEVDNNEFAMLAYHSATPVVDLSRDNTIKISPNPALDHIAIRANSPIQSITIMDLQGKKVYWQSEINQKLADIVCSEFMTGIYVVRVETADGVSVQKLSIH